MIIYDDIYQRYGLSRTQQEIINLVGKGRIILEIGSSTGYMSRAFLQNDCIVDTIEKDKKAFLKSPKEVRKKFLQSIEDPNVGKILNKDYDFIILADVLEHLVDPAKVLRILQKIATEKTQLLICMPNIASWIMRKQLFLKGDFEYRQSGLLDKTHLHFYTVNSLPKLLSENGWEVKKLIGTLTRLPFEETLKKIPLIGILSRLLYKFLSEKYKNLAYYHFLVIARKK